MLKKSQFNALLASAAVGALATATAVPASAENADLVVVTASPIASTAGETAAAITVVTKEELARSGGQNLGEVLGDLPGVSQSSYARGASRPIIRGLDNTRVRVQENGTSAHDVSGISEDHGVPIDPLSAEHVEVLRGPAVLRYGPEAIGGVVHVINNRIPQAAPEDGFDGRIFGDVSEVDQGTSIAAVLDAGNEIGSVHLDGFYRDTDDYDIPRGEVADTYSESQGYAIGGALHQGGAYAGLSLTGFQSEYGIPAAGEEKFIDLEQTKVSFAAGLEREEGPIRGFTLNGGVTDYKHDEVEADTGDIGATFENDEWEARAEALHAPVFGWDGAFGIQYRDRDLSASGEASELLAPNTTEALGVFLFEQRDLTERVNLQVAARFDHTDVNGTAFFTDQLIGLGATTSEAADSQTFETFSASAGLIFALTENANLGLTLARTARAPDTVELYSKGPHEATETFEIGDSTLDEESAVSVEATLKWSTERVSFNGAVFYTDFSDFIYKAFTGNSCDDDFDSCAAGGGNELTQLLFTQTDAEFYGIEADTEFETASINGVTIGVDGRFDYVKGTLDGAGDVPRLTPWRVGTGVFAETDRIFARLGALYVAEQDEIGANETPTKGYTDLQAELVWNATAADSHGPQVQVGLTGRNLLDEDARNHSSFKKEDVLLPGRSVRGFVSVSF